MLSIGRRDLMKLAALAAGWPLASVQASERMRVVGILGSLPVTDRWSRVNAVIKVLKRLGWVEGDNIRFEIRATNGDPVARPALAKELVDLKPDVILAGSTPDTAALLALTRTIPIVFATVADPVGNGFVQSLSRPGGNATGFTNSHASMSGKWLELLKQMVPHTKRVMVLFNPKTAPRGGDYFLEPMKEAAPSFGIEVTPAPIGEAGAIAPVIERIARDPEGALVLIPDSFTVAHRGVIVKLAAEHRVPAIYPFRYFTMEGGLISYGFFYDEQASEVADLVNATAEYLDLVLKGADPADLPVQSPRRYELVINLKTAAALGLPVPRVLLARADKVIE